MLCSKLAQEKVSDHFTRSDPDGDPEGGQVEGRRENIGETKGKHRWDPALSEFESPASAFRHHVLLDRAAAEVVNGSGGIVLGLERTGWERELLANKNVEVVVGGMASSMAFSANGRAEEDEVLCHRRVQDVHAPHSTSGIVEHPFRLEAVVVFVDVGRCSGVCFERIENLIEDSRGVVWVLLYCTGGNVEDLVMVEDVKPMTD